MIKIILFLSVVGFIILLVLKYKDSQKISNSMILKFALLVFSLVGIHQFQTNKLQKDVTLLLNSYKSGKTLICKNKEISNKTHTYQNGTMVFLSKIQSIQKFPIEECKIKE